MAVTWVHVALLLLFLLQAAMIALAIVTWRHSRRLSSLQEYYVNAVARGNYARSRSLRRCLAHRG